jgi:glycosyltransferase involved in cell wall biosynthesis
VVAGDLSGGAAKGAYILHKELLKQGVNSTILSNSSFRISGDNSIFYVSKVNFFTFISNLLWKALERIQLFKYTNRMNRIFSTGFFGTNFLKYSVYREADIVHLHWINAGLVDIKTLQSIDKPIVWTIRDMWPMTGGCHYTMGCDRFKVGCGKCPQLGSNMLNDLSHKVVERKSKYLPTTTTLVGISEWVTNLARESYLFKDFDIITINNGVDTSSFIRFSKEYARNCLGISTKKRIILVGSAKLSDYYKGLDKFLESLSYLDKEECYLMFFGNVDPKILQILNFEFNSLGYIDNYNRLSLAYSAADVFVAPSIQEAFGKTIVESIACGTPVVTFDVGGPKYIVSQGITGYKAKPYDSRDLAIGISWVLENIPEIDVSFCDDVRVNFDVYNIAGKYIELYQRRING